MSWKLAVPEMTRKAATTPNTRTSIERWPISQAIAAQASAVAPGIDSSWAAGPARVCQQSKAAASAASAATAAQGISRSGSRRLLPEHQRIADQAGDRQGHRLDGDVEAVPPDRHRLAHLGEPQPLELGRGSVRAGRGIAAQPQREGAGEQRAGQRGDGRAARAAAPASAQASATATAPAASIADSQTGVSASQSGAMFASEVKTRKAKAQPPPRLTP